MAFLSPIWLFALVPWTALTVWLLWGRRKRVEVPFLDLWRGPVRSPRATRAVQVPPVALACAIAAMLLSILGMAVPMIGAGGGEPLVIIFDRGLTMSGRLDATVRAANDEIVRRFRNGPTTY